MAVLSGLTTVCQSFYSPAVYREAVNQGKGIYGLFLFVLIVVCLLPWAVLTNLSIHQFHQFYNEKIADQMPSFKVTDGKVSISQSVPYSIIDKATGKPIVMIDTRSVSPTFTNRDADYYVTGSQVFERIDNNQYQQYDLSSVKSFNLTPEEIKNTLKNAYYWFYFIIFPLIIAGVFIYHLLKVMLLGVFCVIISKLLKVSLYYQQSLRLCVLAVTPSIILSMILFYVQVRFPYQGLSYLVLSLGYMIFGIMAQKQEKETA